MWVELAVFGFADHHQDGEKLVARQYVSEQAQFLEGAKLPARDTVPFQKWPVGRETMPCVGGRLGRRRPHARIHHRLRLRMREQEYLLPAHSKRLFQPSHQGQRGLAFSALEIRDMARLDAKLFGQSALRKRQPRTSLFEQLSQRVFRLHMSYSSSSALLKFA